MPLFPAIPFSLYIDHKNEHFRPSQAVLCLFHLIIYWYCFNLLDIYFFYLFNDVYVEWKQKEMLMY
jgi:hypothetical protein